MKLENILEAAKNWNSVKILTQPDEEYPTLKEGEIVVDFNDELMMSYDGNGTLVLCQDFGQLKSL